MGSFSENLKSKKTFSGFTLMELIVVMGIIAILTAASIPAINRARRNAIDNQRINALNRIVAALNTYYSQNRKYPDSLDELKTIIPSSALNIPGTNSPFFYQKNYQFCNPIDTNCTKTNSNWRNAEDTAAGFLGLNKGTPEFKKQYYAWEDTDSSSCSYLKGRTVYYRLGAPLLKSEQVAQSDPTPCSDRFFDALGQ
jgi:prepilin-type N-terminal cleavage/methylation domain-containing protein